MPGSTGEVQFSTEGTRFRVRHLDNGDRCVTPGGCRPLIGKVTRFVVWNRDKNRGYVFYSLIADDSVRSTSNPYPLEYVADVADKLIGWLECSELLPGWGSQEPDDGGS